MSNVWKSVSGNWMLMGLVIVLLALAVIFGPIFTIWALNRIFGMAIEVSGWNWLSVAWLSFIVSGTARRSK